MSKPPSNHLFIINQWILALSKKGKIDPHLLNNFLTIYNNCDIYSSDQNRDKAYQWFLRLKFKEDDKQFVRIIQRYFNENT